MRAGAVIVFLAAFALALVGANAVAQIQNPLADPRFASDGSRVLSNYMANKFYSRHAYVVAGHPWDSLYFKTYIAVHPSQKFVFIPGTDPHDAQQYADSDEAVNVVDVIRRKIEDEQVSRDTVIHRGLLALRGYTTGYVIQPFETELEAFRDTVVTGVNKFPAAATDIPHSSWDSTIEPILVTVGAAAIVALFFIIRS